MPFLWGSVSNKLSLQRQFSPELLASLHLKFSINSLYFKELPNLPERPLKQAVLRPTCGSADGVKLPSVMDGGTRLEKGSSASTIPEKPSETLAFLPPGAS